ncbi:hypothetical protein [Sessilibacter sp. MAH4]
MNKKWVFESLVKDDKDAIGLIAYALYKHKKHNLANNLRADGASDVQIEQQVKTFHDQALLSDSLNDYREMAVTYFDALISEAEEKYNEKQRLQKKAHEDKVKSLKLLHEKEIKNLNTKHINELKRQEANLLKKIKEYSLTHKSVFEKLVHWLFSGIPSTISTFLLTALFLGSVLFFTSEEKRKEVFSEFASKYISIQSSGSNKTP